MSKNYLVYDPITDTLNLNEDEQKLLTEITEKPKFYHGDILKRYFHGDTDKQKFKRLEEVLLVYYNGGMDAQAIRLIRMMFPKQLVESLLEMIQIYGKEARENGINKSGPSLTLKDIFASDEKEFRKTFKRIIQESKNETATKTYQRVIYTLMVHRDGFNYKFLPLATLFKREFKNELKVGAERLRQGMHKDEAIEFSEKDDIKDQLKPFFTKKKPK